MLSSQRTTEILFFELQYFTGILVADIGCSNGKEKFKKDAGY